MKTVCIGMDDQGQFFVGMKPEGMGGAPQAAPMGNSMDPNSDSDYRDEMPPADDYMQPVQSMAEAFQTARTMLTEGGDEDKQAQFDAGVSRVLGPNPKPKMSQQSQATASVIGRGAMKGGM